jgi:hypothetical protein
VSKRAAVDGRLPGEHGDCAVAILSSIKVGGQRPEQFAPGVLDDGELIVRANRIAPPTGRLLDQCRRWIGMLLQPWFAMALA